MGKKNANHDEKSIAEEEAIRLKSLAQKRFKSSNLRSALKYANRAHRLCPAVEGVSEMVTTFRILHAAADAATSDSDPDWYKILDLEHFSEINSIKSQYKKLALILHPDKNSLDASGEALKLVNDAFQVLTDRVRRKEFDMKLADSNMVLTNCTHCRLVQKIDRKCMQQSLVCSSCKKSFRALDTVADEDESGDRKSSRIRVSSDIGNEVEEEMTLAQMRSKLKKKTEGNKKSKVREERPLVLRNGNMKVMEVEDSEFYDFDRERAERSFKSGQVWAIYDDDDGMPRHYGLIQEVVSINPFEVKMVWLNLQNSDDHSLIAWEKMGFHVSCGRFKAATKDKINLVNIFSHIAKSERVARETYRIYPHKGSVWALYKEVNCSNRCYEVVLVLTSYSETHGINMVCLEKVDGYRSVFRRKDVGHRSVEWIEKFDYKQFSHQIPARKLYEVDDDGVPDHLKSCWELDPAALPSHLLAFEPLS